MTVPVTINDKWTLQLPPHRTLGNDWWTVWEKERLASMHANLRPGMVVYDVGAEEGDFPALWQTWVGSGGGVVMIEPNPLYWPNIKAVWDANVLPLPLGAFVGFASDVEELDPPRRNFDVGIADDGWPIAAHGPIFPTGGFRHLAQQADSTPRTTLDALSYRIGRAPDAITIDVEGAEWNVLYGASEVLDAYHPLVWVSIHPEFMEEMYGTTPEDVRDLMADHDYLERFLVHDHEAHWLFWHRDEPEPAEA